MMPENLEEFIALPFITIIVVVLLVEFVYFCIALFLRVVCHCDIPLLWW